MNKNSNQSIGKIRSGAVYGIIGVIIVLFAFIWLLTPEVDASLELISPGCELTDPDDPDSCEQQRTDEVTVFRWTRSDNPKVDSYRVIFSDLPSKIILELSESDSEKIIAPQVALDLGSKKNDQDEFIFDTLITYF